MCQYGCSVCTCGGRRGGGRGRWGDRVLARADTYGNTGAEAQSIPSLVLEQEACCQPPPTEVLQQEQQVDHHRACHHHPYRQTSSQARVRPVVQDRVDGSLVCKVRSIERVVNAREANVDRPK